MEEERKRTFSSVIHFSVSCLLSAVFCILYFVLPFYADAKTGIINTKHNLSETGPGELKALPGADQLQRICIFCHTPHNAAPRTPLWNRAVTEGASYDIYASATIHVTPSQPSGPSRLCLGCHDGTIALGQVLRFEEELGPNRTIATTGEITPARPSYIGTFLKDDHPVSFPYYAATVNPEIFPSPPQDLPLYGTDFRVQCSTCHDPHDNAYKKFLVADNKYSALCTRCHNKDGWPLTTHRTSPAEWNGVSPNPWPRTNPVPQTAFDLNYRNVNENGCENCHTPHSAVSGQRLLNCFAETGRCAPFTEEGNCYPCHNGHVASKDIKSQFVLKPSRHPVELTTIGITANYHAPRESPLLLTGHVECVDCHNPHASNSRSASAPFISGRLEKVSGIDSTGAPLIPPAQYSAKEYEVCFKCHADSSSLFPYIPRAINQTNTRFEFDTVNPAYHPIISNNPLTTAATLPSLNPPSQDIEAPPGLSASSMIYCTDCHSDESVTEGGSGSRGPHGSVYAPILRRRYETVDGTPGIPQNYALCFRCHNQASIFGDQSFSRHNLHIAGQNTPCSICHDPHGIRDNGVSGSHTHLVNFDTRIATPLSPNTVPIFTDTGTFSGSCTLVCHGRTHNNLSY